MQRKYFGTDGIRGQVGEFPITPEFVMKLAQAAGSVLSRHAPFSKQVLIGKDTRISGYMLESALEAGFSSVGVDIQLLGPMPTPAIAYLTRTFKAQAGIVISASHNPYQDNGIKFFSTDGFKLSDEIEAEIEKYMENDLHIVEPAQLGKAKRLHDAAGRYIEYCKSTIPNECNLAGMKIILDCANGATYRIAPSIFKELGATIKTIGNKPDGININHNCGSTQLGPLKEMVIQEQADLGIAFDGDGDRVLMIDHEGKTVDGDEILYIIAKDKLQRGVLKGGVVGTAMSNMGLEHSLNALGVEFMRTPVGDRYVIDELRKRGWRLGGEASGHIICLGETTTGDGIIAALQVVYLMSNQRKSLHELRREMNKFPQKLVNIPTSQAKQLAENGKIQAQLSSLQQQLKGKGRILLRPSGTEACLRLLVESKDEGLVEAYTEKMSQLIVSLETASLLS